MSHNLKTILLCTIAVAAVAPAEARHHYRPAGPVVVNPSPDTGGYCDNYGCPDHFWTYPIFYGPVFAGGVWYRGPVYVRDDQWGHHWFWVHGDWRRDEWRAARPYWARNVRFGPPLDFAYYESHGFRVEGRWRHEHEAWMGDHREAWNHGAPGNYQSGNYPGQGPNQGGYQGQPPNSPNDEWSREHYGERHGGSGENWHQGPPPDQYSANPQQNGGNNQGPNDWGGRNNQGGPNSQANGNWHDRGQGGPNNGQPSQQGQGGQGGSPSGQPSQQAQNGPSANAPGPSAPSPNANGPKENGPHPGPAATASNGPPPNLITVKSATYGASCNQNKGNVTKYLQDACNGHDRCDYSVRYQAIGGDPAPGCIKDFSVEWSCSDGSGGSASAPAEAGLGSKVTLQCAGVHG